MVIQNVKIWGLMNNGSLTHCEVTIHARDLQLTPNCSQDNGESEMCNGFDVSLIVTDLYPEEIRH